MEKVPELFSLKGKVSLITGGARGLGFGIAKALAQAGSDIIIVARTSSQLSKAEEEIRKDTGREVLALEGDVSQAQDLDKIVETSLKRFGAIDVLVNNAGVNVRKPFVDMTTEDFDFVIGINLRGAYFLTQKIVKHMIQRGQGGRIINIASLSSQIGIPNISVYGASKGGIYSLTKALAIELAHHGIRVNAIAPGYFRTDLTEPLFQDPARSNWIHSRIPLGRPGLPDDLGGAAVFLASKASDYLTGAVLFVDGGWMSG